MKFLILLLLLASCKTIPIKEYEMRPVEVKNNLQKKYLKLKGLSLQKAMANNMVTENESGVIVVGDSLGWTGLKFCSYLIEGDISTAKKIWFEGMQKSKLGPGQYVRYNDFSLIDVVKNPFSRDHMLMGVIFPAVCIKKHSQDKELIESARKVLDEVYIFVKNNKGKLAKTGQKDRIKMSLLKPLLVLAMDYLDTDVLNGMFFIKRWYSVYTSNEAIRIDIVNAQATKLKRVTDKVKHWVGYYEFHLLFIKLMSYHFMGYNVEKGFKGFYIGFKNENPLYVLPTLSFENKSLEFVEKELAAFPDTLPREGHPFGSGFHRCYKWQHNPIRWAQPIEGYGFCAATDYEFLYQLYRYFRR